ncbi:MAG: glycosyltransferase family 4 protein [bacterium]
MKQVAFVKATYKTPGGAEKYSVRLIHAFLEAGCSVNLLTLPGQKWPDDWPDHNRDRLAITPLGHQNLGRAGRLIAFQTAVSRHVRLHSYDVVFGIDYTDGQTHMRAGGGTHRSFLEYRDETRSIPARILRSASMFHRLKLTYEKKAIESPRLQRLYCNSEMVKQEIAARYRISPQKIKVVHNGVEWKSFEYLFHHKDEIKGELLARHQLPAGSRFLLFTGTGFERKGLEYAIEGMQHLPPDFHLLIVGKGETGPYRKMAGRLFISERIHFLGPQEEASRYLALADGFILPTRYDPFSNASLEALAAGVPVLTTDRNGCAEVIQPGNTGVILSFPVRSDQLRKSVEDFTQVMQRAANPLYRKQIRDSVQYLDFAENLRSIVSDVLKSDLPKPKISEREPDRNDNEDAGKMKDKDNGRSYC